MVLSVLYIICVTINSDTYSYHLAYPVLLILYTRTLRLDPKHLVKVLNMWGKTAYLRVQTERLVMLNIFVCSSTIRFSRLIPTMI